MTFPGLASSEEIRVRGFALQLYDGYTGASRLEGRVIVSIAGQRTPVAKVDSATFVFLNIAAGAYTISVQSGAATPYYLSADVPVTVPIPGPGQPAAYLAQATLRPTPHYPFPADATLVRGTVLAAGAPLPSATVLRLGDAAGAVSDVDGEFVLFFDDVGVTGQAATIQATHPHFSNTVDVPVTLQRGTTVSIRMIMSP